MTKDLNPRNSSVIKFGSYDTEAIQKGENISYIRTINTSTWAINLYSVSINNEAQIFDRQDEREFLIEP